jgi:hypothetical protein
MAEPTDQQFESFLQIIRGETALGMKRAVLVLNRERKVRKYNCKTEVRSEMGAAGEHVDALRSIHEKYEELRRSIEDKFEAAIRPYKEKIEKLSMRRNQKLASLRKRYADECQPHQVAIEELNHQRETEINSTGSTA